MAVDHRLATYGTLAPGRVNHHQLAGLSGEWTTGTIRGRLVETGWGAALGYPALVLDAEGEAIAVHLFTSADLPAHWARLDAFEGAEYRRGEVAVETAQGVVPAWIYLAADGPYSS
jgi:gamma-glutamylcyclotransferase (GGCT)/AIG2-like uncharacterized protein YtfP